MMIMENKELELENLCRPRNFKTVFDDCVMLCMGVAAILMECSSRFCAICTQLPGVKRQ